MTTKERLAMALAMTFIALMCVGPRVIAGGWILGLQLAQRLGWFNAKPILSWLAGGVA